MAAQRILLNVMYANKPFNSLQKCVRTIKTSTQPVYLFPSKQIPSSYTREKKLNPNYKARWVAPTAMELNRRREKVAFDQKLRHGQEDIVRRSQFTDWNYSAEISAFQARLGEKFDEEKLLQAFKTREYLEDITIQRRQTFGIEKHSFDNEEGRHNSLNLNLTEALYIVGLPYMTNH